METIATLIGNFGFPIALVIYLFTRFEKKLTEVIQLIEDLETLLKENNREQKE